MDLAGAIGDFVDSLRLRTVDMFGYQLGALVAAELAIARPQQIRRLMLWGAPCHSPQERAAALQSATTPGTREDGSDVVEEWQRMLQRRGANAPPAALADELGDRLRAGASGTRAAAAAIDYPTLSVCRWSSSPRWFCGCATNQAAPRVRSVAERLMLTGLRSGFLSAARSASPHRPRIPRSMVSGQLAPHADRRSRMWSPSARRVPRHATGVGAS
jgi:pimeloyl-ACP methyl ester carboxylesterase